MYKKPIINDLYNINLFFTCDNKYHVYIDCVNILEANSKQIHLGDINLAHFSIISYYYKTISWISEKTIRISHSNNRDYWEYCLDSNEVIFHYLPAESGNTKGLYDLSMIYLEGKSGVLKNEAKSLFYLEQYSKKVSKK